METKCKKHPKYKAIRKPIADCQECREMWSKKQEETKKGEKNGRI